MCEGAGPAACHPLLLLLLLAAAPRRPSTALPAASPGGPYSSTPARTHACTHSDGHSVSAPPRASPAHPAPSPPWPASPAGPWRPLEEEAPCRCCRRPPPASRTLGRLDAHAQEELWVHERQLDGLSELADLLAEPADGRVVHLAGVLLHHVEHHWVHLRRARCKGRRSVRVVGVVVVGPPMSPAGNDVVYSAFSCCCSALRACRRHARAAWAGKLGDLEITSRGSARMIVSVVMSSATRVLVVSLVLSTLLRHATT